jgi:hypothetical protein
MDFSCRFLPLRQVVLLTVGSELGANAGSVVQFLAAQPRWDRDYIKEEIMSGNAGISKGSREIIAGLGAALACLGAAENADPGCADVACRGVLHC